MHSSRMRTACSSSRPGGAPPGTPREQIPPQDQASLGSRYLPPGPGTPGTRHPPGARPPDQAPPLVDRHTPVNILPCPKPRLRAIIIRDCTQQTKSKGPLTQSGSEKKKRSQKKRQVPKNIFVSLGVNGS